MRLDIEHAVIKNFFSCGPEQGSRLVRVQSGGEQALPLRPLQPITWTTPLGTASQMRHLNECVTSSRTLPL